MDERRSDVVVAGHRLEVVAIGPPPGEAPTLVFLHEGLGSASQWRDVPHALCERTGCGALVYSRWGYGRSDRVTLPRPLTYMHDEARALTELLDACRIHRCVLVGQSDGASIAILHASLPEAKPRVKGIALEAPHVFVEDVSIRAIKGAKRAFDGGLLRDGMAKYHDDPDGAFLGWNGAWLDPGFRGWNIEDRLATIEAKVLVIQGEGDPYGTLAQVDAIARGVPGGAERLILPECGHAPHRDRPEETIAEIAAFARRALAT